MSETSTTHLQRRLAGLKRRQEIRLELIAERKADMDANAEKHQREIDNLEAQLQGVVRPLKVAR